MKKEGYSLKSNQEDGPDVQETIFDEFQFLNAAGEYCPNHQTAHEDNEEQEWNNMVSASYSLSSTIHQSHILTYELFPEAIIGLV